jgi:hypothetical protein
MTTPHFDETYDVVVVVRELAGQLGSAFGHLYLSGGNIAECFVSGGIAGRNVAALTPWDNLG